MGVDERGVSGRLAVDIQSGGASVGLNAHAGEF